MYNIYKRQCYENISFCGRIVVCETLEKDLSCYLFLIEDVSDKIITFTYEN